MFGVSNFLTSFIVLRFKAEVQEIIIIIIKFKFIPRSFYKNIQLRLTINIKLEIKIEVQNYNSKIMQFNYKNYRTN